MATKKSSSTSPEWSFSFRTDFYSDSDPDSDNNTDEFDQTRLINDLDLSLREETVLYKPNPFSIAKINAASRLHGAGAGDTLLQEPPTKARTSLKAKTAQPTLKGNILDGFKKQAERCQGHSLYVNALKPGVMISRPSATIEPRSGRPGKPSTKATNSPLPIKTATSSIRPKSVPFQMLFPKSKARIQPGTGMQSSNAAVVNVLPTIDNAPPLPSISSRSSASTCDTPRHDPTLVPGTTPSSHSPIPSNLGLERTHILTETQRTLTPIHDLVLPLIVPQPQGSQTLNPATNPQQPEFPLQLSGPLASSLLSSPNLSHHVKDNDKFPADNSVPLSLESVNRTTYIQTPALTSQAATPMPAYRLPISYKASVSAKVPRSTTGLENQKPKVRPLDSGPFSSPALLPSRPRDNFNADSRAFPISSMPLPMPLSSPVRPSDSYSYANASANASANSRSCALSETRVVPSRRLNLATSRHRFPGSGHGLQHCSQLQPQLQSRPGPPFQYDFQHPPQHQIQTEMEPIPTTHGSRSFSSHRRC